jgi:hypothetical protein
VSYSASGPFSAFTIRANVFGSAGSFNGLIEEVAIVNNGTLTAIEIRELYEAATVHEPASLVLFSCAGIALAFLWSRRRPSTEHLERAGELLRERPQLVDA